VKNEEEWITAAEALRLLKPVFGSEYAAILTICTRAHAGLIRARAEHFMIDDKSRGPQEVPKEFWWAEGHAATLKQNWTSGDFETWIKQRTRLRAFSVSFSRADIEKLIPTEPEAPPAPKPEGETGRVDGEWDVFISHASEDKEDFVRPLAESLTRSGLRVWYDDFTLRVGDSIRRSIDHGLAKSRYGIVVISPNSLREWPQKELDALVGREVDGVKVILPVWHNIDADEVRRYSPMLADRVAVSSSKGIDRVTSELLHAIHKGTSSHSSRSGGSLAQSDGNRPLRFVQNEQQSFWGPLRER
jgi:TIR domain